MALFGIGDLHLSLSVQKPMDVFDGWSGYTERLVANWTKRVSDDDVVVIPGDVSWAASLTEAGSDFALIEKLPGRKIILKGNHDYWWSTVRKIKNWIDENDYSSIQILSNDSFVYKNKAIAGTRGWILDRGSPEDMKVYGREIGRLRLSLEDAKTQGCDETLVFLHYPPIYSTYLQREIIEVLHDYNVKRCFYGHVHGKSIRYAADKDFEGIFLKLISADHLNFSPYYIEP